MTAQVPLRPCRAESTLPTNLLHRGYTANTTSAPVVETVSRHVTDRTQTNRWLVLVIVCLAQFMVVLDATIVNVALPSIQRGLHFSASSLQWVVNAYTLVFGGFLLLGGRAADLFGPQAAVRRRRRRVHGRLAAQRARDDVRAC